jgi:hypothetical protein
MVENSPTISGSQAVIQQTSNAHSRADRFLGRLTISRVQGELPPIP